MLTLPDGRALGWATYGDPDGRPIVALHGSPDSRVIWRLAHDAAAELGIAIIAPDRPGFGLSDPAPGRTVLDWVADHRVLAAHLQLGPCPLIAVSGGSPYATAIAWADADTVTHLGLFSAISPLHVPGVLRGCNRPVATLFRIARVAPVMLRPLAGMMVRAATRNPENAEARLLRMRPPADREVIARPEVLQVLRENLPNQFRDAGSIAHEMRLAARDWGFPLEDIRVPTTIWQGGRDDVHTPAMAYFFGSVIEGSILEFEPEFATFNWIDQMDQILAVLVAR